MFYLFFSRELVDLTFDKEPSFSFFVLPSFWLLVFNFSMFVFNPETFLAEVELKLLLLLEAISFSLLTGLILIAEGRLLFWEVFLLADIGFFYI